jgi:hypothetical protein
LRAAIASIGCYLSLRPETGAWIQVIRAGSTLSASRTQSQTPKAIEVKPLYIIPTGRIRLGDFNKIQGFIVSIRLLKHIPTVDRIPFIFRISDMFALRTRPRPYIRLLLTFVIVCGLYQCMNKLDDLQVRIDPSLFVHSVLHPKFYSVTVLSHGWRDLQLRSFRRPSAPT